MEVVQGKSSREVGASLGRVWPPEGLHGEGLQELLEFQKESPGMDSPQGWSDGKGQGRVGAAAESGTSTLPLEFPSSEQIWRSSFGEANHSFQREASKHRLVGCLYLPEGFKIMKVNGELWELLFISGSY